MTRSRISHRRSGFTLLEILIVVAIVALLASFLTVAIGRSITQAKEAATRTTLLKLDGLLQQRLEAFRVLMDSPQKQNEMKSRVTKKKSDLQNGSPSITGLNEKMLQLMVYKDYYKAGFPQTLNDNPNLGNVTGTPFYGNTTSTAKEIAAESSEFLFWLVTQADTFGVPAVDDSEFSSAEVADTDGDGRMEFVDAWGQPLRFYRWPTRLIRYTGPVSPGGSLALTPAHRKLAGILMRGLPAAPTNAGDSDPLIEDPDDRLGIFLATLSRDQSSPVITPAQFEALYHTPSTYHIPLIVSAGPDRDTGLEEPWDNPLSQTDVGRLAMPTATALTDASSSAMNDNLTNRQKQQK